MNESQLIVGVITLAAVAVPFLIAVFISQQFAGKVLVWLAVIIMSCLLGWTYWLYNYGPNEGYGREATAMLFFTFIALPVIVFATIGLAIGHWLSTK